MKVLIQKMSRPHSLQFCLYKVVCIDGIFTKPIVVYRGYNAADEFIKAILKLDSKFLDETNKKVIGKMKDEFGGVIVKEGPKLNETVTNIEWVRLSL